MRTRITIGLTLLPWLLADQPPKQLLGHWLSLERTFDGIAETMTFYKDGTVDSSIVYVSDGAYRVEGGELVFLQAQRVKIEFTGLDQLRIGESVMRRQGAAVDVKRPILGEWVGMLDVEGKRREARYLFYPDGRSLFVMPTLQRTGKYTIQGLTMRVEVPDSLVREGEFRIEGDVLTVPGWRARQLPDTPDKYRRY